MEVKINREIKDYNETIFFGLSVRQFLFALLACGAAVGVYFGCRSFLGTEVLSWLCMLAAVPFAVFGFVRYQGMTAEKLIAAWLSWGFGEREIRSEVRMPRKLLYRGDHKKQEGEV